MVSSVLDSNVELPGICYGEDALNGISIASYDPVDLKYDGMGSNGLPMTTDIFIGGTAVATVNFAPEYIGEPFAITHEGQTHCFLLQEQDIYI